MSQYDRLRSEGRRPSLGLAFREIGSAFLIHVVSQSGNEKGTNYNLAKLEPDLG
jgi:hypothetical protein